MHAVGDDQRLALHAATLADLLDLRVEPEVGEATLERPLAEGGDPLVERAAQPRDLVLEIPARPSASIRRPTSPSAAVA